MKLFDGTFPTSAFSVPAPKPQSFPTPSCRPAHPRAPFPWSPEAAGGPCPAGPLAASRGRYSPRERPGAPGTAGSSPAGSSPALGVPAALPAPGACSAGSAWRSSALRGCISPAPGQNPPGCPQVSSGPLHCAAAPHCRPCFPSPRGEVLAHLCIGMALRCGSVETQGGCVRYVASPRCTGHAMGAHKYQHQLQVCTGVMSPAGSEAGQPPTCLL